MARTIIPVIALDREGDIHFDDPLAVGDAVNGMAVDNSQSRMFLMVRNNGDDTAGLDFVLIADNVDGVTVPDKRVLIEDGQTIMLGPFPRNWYTQSNPSPADTYLEAQGEQAPSDFDQITIGSVTYEYQSSISAFAGQVSTDVSDLVAVLQNTADAINLTDPADLAGLEYGEETVAHPQVRAGEVVEIKAFVDDLVNGIRFTSKMAGSLGNTVGGCGIGILVQDDSSLDFFALIGGVTDTRNDMTLITANGGGTCQADTVGALIQAINLEWNVPFTAELLPGANPTEFVQSWNYDEVCLLNTGQVTVYANPVNFPEDAGTDINLELIPSDDGEFVTNGWTGPLVFTRNSTSDLKLRAAAGQTVAELIAWAQTDPADQLGGGHSLGYYLDLDRFVLDLTDTSSADEIDAFPSTPLRSYGDGGNPVGEFCKGRFAGGRQYLPIFARQPGQVVNGQIALGASWLAEAPALIWGPQQSATLDTLDTWGGNSGLIMKNDYATGSNGNGTTFTFTYDSGADPYSVAQDLSIVLPNAGIIFGPGATVQDVLDFFGIRTDLPVYADRIHSPDPDNVDGDGLLPQTTWALPFGDGIDPATSLDGGLVGGKYMFVDFDKLDVNGNPTDWLIWAYSI